MDTAVKDWYGNLLLHKMETYDAMTDDQKMIVGDALIHPSNQLVDRLQAHVVHLRAIVPWHRGDEGSPDVPVLQPRYDALRGRVADLDREYTLSVETGILAVNELVAVRRRVAELEQQLVSAADLTAELKERLRHQSATDFERWEHLSEENNALKAAQVNPVVVSKVDNELVEALTHISTIEHKMNGGDWDEIEEAQKIARDAIAKHTLIKGNQNEPS